MGYQGADKPAPERVSKTMKKATIIKGAIIACCLIGMLVLPAAAAGQGNATIDPGLKNALWTEQGQHRLAVFDLNVQHANNVIGILGQYNIDTTQMQATLAQITGERSALQSAFADQDRNALKTVNQQLVTLWKQFRQEAQTAVRGHYKPAAQAVSTGGMALGDTDTGTTV